MLTGPSITAVRRSSSGQLERAALSSCWAQKDPGEEMLGSGGSAGREVEKSRNKGGTNLTNSSSKLRVVMVFAPRCEDLGILGN